MSTKVLILVEGITEEAFVNKLLQPSLGRLDLHPTIVKTRSTGPQPDKGGTVKYGEFRRQLQLLLRDSSASLVTTMVDYQGIGSDFPGKATLTGNTAIERVNHLEEALRADIGHSRFHPYIALHEFEAMLFVRPEVIAEVIQERLLLPGLQAVRAKYPHTPEDINDSPATSPSARIENLCRDIVGSPKIFRKPLHGPIITARIGLDAIRSSCPHFDTWVKTLEALATPLSKNPEN